MFDGPAAAFIAIAPAFLTIFAGYALRQFRIMPSESWIGVNRLTFFVLAPLYVLDLVTNVDVSVAAAPRLTIALVCGVLLAAGGVVCLRPLLPDGPRFASLFQSVVRWNAMVLLAIAPQLMGREAAALLA